jgi:hypothetical protein
VLDGDKIRLTDGLVVAELLFDAVPVEVFKTSESNPGNAMNF